MTEPTDDEIDALVAAYLGDCGPQATRVYSFARAVLAKWGSQPAVAGEPVACGNCGGTGWMVRDPDIGTDQECFVCGGSGGYSESATPQPTQAQAVAVPLTDGQAASLCKMGPVYAPDGQVVRTPEQYRRELEGAKLAGIRTAERAHGIGIKGGQHGTE